MDIGPIAGNHREFGDIRTVLSSFGAIFRGTGRNFSIVQAFSNEQQLHPKQHQLADANNDKPKREEPGRIVRYPLPKGFVLLVFICFSGSVLGTLFTVD